MGEVSPVAKAQQGSPKAVKECLLQLSVPVRHKAAPISLVDTVKPAKQKVLDVTLGPTQPNAAMIMTGADTENASSSSIPGAKTHSVSTRIQSQPHELITSFHIEGTKNCSGTEPIIRGSVSHATTQRQRSLMVDSAA